MDDPPGIPASFGRQKTSNSALHALKNAMSEIAKHMASASAAWLVWISPAKVANLRTSYLQQLRDLHQLFDCGAITESEFTDQKKTHIRSAYKAQALNLFYQDFIILYD